MPVFKNPIAISKAKRTPFGSFLSAFKSKTATELAGYTLKAVIPDEKIDYVYMGCVLSSGLGQGPARQAAFNAGISFEVSAATINKVCGSGLLSVIFGCNDIALNNAKCVLAGGMESLTNAPFVSKTARIGSKMGHTTMYDSLLKDGLEDAYSSKLMGAIADNSANQYKISRESQENYVEKSLKRYNDHDFSNEIIAVDGIEKDEPPLKVRPEKFKLLKPSFGDTITAATSSSLADGAAAICLKKEDKSAIAYIVGHATYSTHPNDFAITPSHAIKKLCEELSWNIADVDLFEINEAFAVVPLIAINQLNLDSSKVNKNGGACITGHPLGATGTRLIVTLALQLLPGQKAIAAACIGGGEAIAVAIQK